MSGALKFGVRVARIRARLVTDTPPDTVTGRGRPGPVCLAPRTYDYDKVLFLGLGVFLFWRYLDRPSTRNLVVAAAATLIAALFRYDTGMYIGRALAAGLVAAHWGDWGVMTRRLGLYVGAIVLAGLPAPVFVQMTAGLGVALDQVVSYARAQALAWTFEPPTVQLDQAPDWSGSPVNVRWVAEVDDAEGPSWSWGMAWFSPSSIPVTRGRIACRTALRTTYGT